VRDLHFDLVLLQLAGIVFVWQQVRTGRVRRQPMNLTHLVCYPFVWRLGSRQSAAGKCYNSGDAFAVNCEKPPAAHVDRVHVFAKSASKWAARLLAFC
jgi:hypothetical protein